MATWCWAAAIGMGARGGEVTRALQGNGQESHPCPADMGIELGPTGTKTPEGTMSYLRTYRRTSSRWTLTCLVSGRPEPDHQRRRHVE